ncbi:MAG: transcriptional regulator, MerR family [Bryobacterales bacterium]|jgi:DNA-binding transcriptional MerR regulator|nr:transcriptional regulator, MerR family [Bryobacterales bacterium]
MSEPKIAPMAITPDEIPDKLYFRIGEVARLAAIKPYVLRFWETEFSALDPKKSGTGHRLYRRKDVELVLEIKRLLYDKRYTIEGARKFLDTRPKNSEPAAPASVDAPRRSSGRQASAKPVQTGFFDIPSPVLETVRKELREIVDLLK